MKVIIKASRLSTGGVDYRRGDIVDLSDQEMVQLSPYIERLMPTIEVVDERDAKIAELEQTIESLRREIDAKNVVQPGVDNVPPDASTTNINVQKRTRRRK